VALPPPLRDAIERLTAGVPRAVLAAEGATLSARYRGEVRDGRLHVGAAPAALAYLATRLPATFAAVDRALAALLQAAPGFAPGTLLDAGAGPGTVLWAAAAHLPSLTRATHLEASPAFRDLGARLAAGADLPEIAWRETRLPALPADLPPHDLVVASYVLGELSEGDRATTVAALWRRAAGALLLVEPGTPAGFARLRAARTALLAEGARMLAPCPHEGRCPIVDPDWCHMAVRVERSRLHRRAKGAEVPWEDEKFAYLAVARNAGTPCAARVIGPPRAGGGHVALRLCTPDGLVERVVTRTQKETMRVARRLGWGDAFDM
jgi:ribosomal protein RSM22 (predicted rRNA methylase)